MLKRHARKLSAFFVILNFVLCGSSVWAAPKVTPSGLLLTPTNEIQEDPYFTWILAQQDRGAPVEAAKIEYLIERVRKSPYVFHRNGVDYPAARAASHLEWKYGMGKGRIQTAADFIKYLATRSITSSLLYATKFPDGSTYPTGDLLANELSLLESYLTKLLKNAASKSARSS